MVRKIFSIFIILTMTFVSILTAVSAEGETLPSSSNHVVLNIPDTRFDIRNDIILDAAIHGDFTIAHVMLDGKVIESFTQSSGESYAITIGAEVEKYIGENKVNLAVAFTDGSIKRASGMFSTYSPIEFSLIDTDMTKVPSDFPAEGTSANAHTDNLWNSITGQNSKWNEPRGAKLYILDSFSDGSEEYTGKFLKVAKENGKSAELNLQSDTFEAMDSGIIRVTYDVFVTGNITRTRFSFMGLKSEGASGTKYYDMKNFVDNKWNKLILDFDLDKDRLYYTRTADGEVAWRDDTGVSPSEIEKVNQFRLAFLTDSAVADQAYIVKNITVEHLTGKENSLSLTSYEAPGSGNTTLTDSKIHADVQKLILTASDEITSVDSLNIINEAGEQIEGLTFAVRGNRIEVALPDGGVPNGDFTIALGKDTRLGGRNVFGKLSAKVTFYQEKDVAASVAFKVDNRV